LIISIESLVELFEENNDPDQFVYRDQCFICGCDVEIAITKTLVGYGLNGGVLFGPNPKRLRVHCEECYVKTGRG
jgi:hypothetical protein